MIADMVYISLPIVANRLDASRLARFDDLLSQSDNRPLYFCDKDGTLAGLAWYIHLRVVGQDDSQSATSKAEEIGLTEAEVKIAEELPRDPQAESQGRPGEGGHRLRLAVAEAEAGASASPATSGPSCFDPTALLGRGSRRGPAAFHGANAARCCPASIGPRRRTARRRAIAISRSWRPVAALVLTGIGVPLAYWSRSMFSEFRSVRRSGQSAGIGASIS